MTVAILIKTTCELWIVTQGSHVVLRTNCKRRWIEYNQHKDKGTDLDSCQRLSTSYHVQEADIDEMFDFADADSDGRLSFQEFEVVVNVMSCKKQFCEDNIGDSEKDEYVTDDNN